MSDVNFFNTERGGFIEKWLFNKTQKNAIDADGEYSGWQEVDAPNGELKAELNDGSNLKLGVYIYTPVERSGVLCLDKAGLELDEFALNGSRVKVRRENTLCLYRAEIPSQTWDPLAYDFPVGLRAGWNKLTISCRIEPGRGPHIIGARFMGDDGFLMKHIVFATDKHNVPSVHIAGSTKPRVASEPDQVVGQLGDYPLPTRKPAPAVTLAVDEYRLGVGKGKRAVGRFGFTKGDGVLDCAMPYLGVIDKLYLSGHPDYGKLSRWMISMLPPGINPAEKWRGMLQWGRSSGHEHDAITTRWLSVEWKTVFNTIEPFYERPLGRKVKFACTYSLGTPGILVETDDPALSLQGLQTISSFKYIILPLAGGITRRNTEKGGVIFDAGKDGDMTDNWFLLYSANTFPDIPVLVIPQKKPKTISFIRNCEGNLERIDVHAPPSIDSAIVMTPFGMESFKPAETREQAWLKKAVRNAVFWSKAVLAFPVDCEERYKINETAGQVDIQQAFSYRFIKDAWNSKPLMTAPLPPALTLLEDKAFVQLPPDTVDFHFPTKYGYLKGLIGTDRAAYSIPMLLLNRKFPLKPAHDRQIEEELAEEMQSYLDFHNSFDELSLSYCTTACFVSKYAHPLALFNFLKPEFRAAIEERARKAIGYASDINTRFKYMRCDFNRMLKGGLEPAEVLEIYRGLKPAKECCAWYLRREPFSGEEYLIGYINVGIINNDNALKTGSREEVLNYPVALYENDWGAGLALYGIYILALETGAWEIITKNWATLKKAFRYFETMHDWACMGGAYAEQGVTWQEGGNYGAFIAMTQMAKLTGDRETYQDCAYISSKNALLKMATFVSARNYFWKYFSCKPWWGKKLFHDEAYVGAQFNCVPVNEMKGDVASGSIYNLFTEGLYPEILMLLQKYLPEEYREFRDKCLQAYPDWCEKGNAPKANWWENDKGDLGLQHVITLFMMSALDDGYGRAKLLDQLERAAANGRFPLDWFGLHIPDRHIPKNTLKCYVEILAETRNDPLWLEEWKDIRIVKAEYDAKARRATVEYSSLKPGHIVLGMNRMPDMLEVNGSPLSKGVGKNADYYVPHDKKLFVHLQGKGVLTMQYAG